MMERKSKLAVAGSLAWVAMAMALILGTHGPTTAGADGLDPVADVASWHVLPAVETPAALPAPAAVARPSRC